MDFSNLNVLIIGGSSDIGYTLGNILSKYQAKVIGTYCHHKKKAIYQNYRCDLTNEKDLKELFQKVKHEKINVVVNCASLSLDGDIYEKSKKDFMKVLEVNLVGTFLVCKYASLMMEQGVIINISSTDAIDTYNIYNMDYAASKAGVNTLTKSLALRFPNLKICALAPNFVDTQSIREMNPLFLEEELKRVGQKKLLTKEEVALKIIEIILNDDFVSGSIIRMDGKNE